MTTSAGVFALPGANQVIILLKILNETECKERQAVWGPTGPEFLTFNEVSLEFIKMSNRRR